MRRIVERAVEAGHLPPGADVDAVAGVMFSLVPGFALQRVLLGEIDRETYVRGVQTCFDTSMTRKRLPSG